jgi:TPR repeat protein
VQKLKRDESVSNFAFKFNLRRYSVEQNHKLAEAWVRKAAIQGDPKSQGYLGKVVQVRHYQTLS